MSAETRRCPVCEREVLDQSFCYGRPTDAWGRLARHRFVSGPSMDPHALTKVPATGKVACPQCQGELEEIAGSAELGGPPPTLRCEKCDMMWAVEGDGRPGRVMWRSRKDAGEEYA